MRWTNFSLRSLRRIDAGFSAPCQFGFTEAQVTIDVREEPTGLAVDIGVPETFRDGDMLVETKGATFTLQSATIINRLNHPMCLQA